jgi:serine/threonine protein kinase
MPSLAPGQQVTPTLRLVREIGHGSMGRVWVAEHAGLNAEVAVKFLLERVAAIPQVAARFSAEASAAARIRNPHVVQVLDHGVADGLPYIVMELLDGEDLAHRLERDGRLGWGDTLAVVRGVSKALEKAHAMGIVHRDIKPANLFLVTGMGETFVKVLDFGLAKHPEGHLEHRTESSAVFGTPHYMSPEQASRSREATAQSDAWSLAVVAYECLTGKRPFEAKSLMGFYLALHELKFAPPSTLRPDLPRSVDACFERAFRHEPAERFAGTGEFVADLGRALGSLQPGFTQTTWSKSERRSFAVRPRWRAAALAGMIGLCGLAYAGANTGAPKTPAASASAVAPSTSASPPAPPLVAIDAPSSPSATASLPPPHAEPSPSAGTIPPRQPRPSPAPRSTTAPRATTAASTAVPSPQDLFHDQDR